MTPDETREVAALYTRIGALMSARAAWQSECDDVRSLYRDALTRAHNAEDRAKAAETESDEIRKELEFTSRRLAAVEEVHAMPLQLRNERDAALQRAWKAEARVADLEAIIAARGAP